MEGPNVEQQINRINVGIAFIRLNTVILNEMPISGDSKWADDLTTVMTTEMYTKIRSSDAVRNDPYFSTAMLTNLILQRAALSLTSLNARLYLQLNTIYKNSSNETTTDEHKRYSIPDIYELPAFTNMSTFTNFGSINNGKEVSKIEVDAIQYEKYANLEEAAISLTPRKYQQQLLQSRQDYKKAKKDVLKTEGDIVILQEWFKDDANFYHPQRESKHDSLKVAKETLKILKMSLDEADEIYTLLIKDAVSQIEAFQGDDYLVQALPLAKKLDKLLATVDNNALATLSLFASATTHLTKNGLGTLDQEIRALMIAKGARQLVRNQKAFLIQRLSRMTKGALMALPNISIGSYYALKQIREVSRYQTIVDKVLDIGDVS